MPHTSLVTLDRFVSRLSSWQIWVLTLLEVVAIFAVDHLTGHEIPISLLYLIPVATAAWYAGLGASVSISMLACISWFAADFSAGHLYNHMAIPVWNALVRLGFFLVNGYLVLALESSLSHERELARTDFLTGVFGRRAFENRLKHDFISQGVTQGRSRSPTLL